MQYRRNGCGHLCWVHDSDGAPQRQEQESIGRVLQECSLFSHMCPVDPILKQVWMNIGSVRRSTHPQGCASATPEGRWTCAMAETAEPESTIVFGESLKSLSAFKSTGLTLHRFADPHVA